MPQGFKSEVQTIIIQFKSKQILNILTSYLRYLIASHDNFHEHENDIFSTYRYIYLISALNQQKSM